MSKNITPRQLAANRRNAQSSTGPRTPEGKAASRFNALRHGLAAASRLIPGEDAALYEAGRPPMAGAADAASRGFRPREHR